MTSNRVTDPDELLVTRHSEAAPETPARSSPVARRPRDYVIRRMLVLADATGVTISFAVSAALAPSHDASRFIWGLATLPMWLLLFKIYGLYDRDAKRISHTTADDLPWLFHLVVVGSLLTWLLFRALPGYKIAFIQILGFGVTAVLSTALLRAVARATACRTFVRERVLLSADDMARVLLRKMRAHPEYGLEPVGVLALREREPERIIGLPVLGGLDDLPEIVVDHDIDRIVLSTAGLDPADQLLVLREARELTVKVSLLPDVFDAMGPGVAVDDVEGVTVLGVNPQPLSPSSRVLKRSFDLVGAVTMALILAPLMVLAAIAVKLDSPGPVFFRQRRIGRDGKPFRLWKFRTMVSDAEKLVDQLRALSKDPDWLHLEHDPRITRAGRLLRLTSLDELPQLFNVIAGHMSLVGPRPLIESEDRLVAGWARSRLNLTPGITGSWQVLGRTNIPFEEMVKLDYLYVMNWSLWNDVQLMLRTLPAVLARRGAN